MKRRSCPGRVLPSSPVWLLPLLVTAAPFEARAGARIMNRVRAGERAPAQASPPAPAAPAPPALAAAHDAVAASDAVAEPGAVAREAASPGPAPLDQGAALLPNDADDTEALEPGVDLKASMGVVRRSLRFYQDVYDRLRALDANLFVHRLDASVYPAFRVRGLDGQVALIGGFEAAFAGSVRDDDFGGEYPIAYSELFAGLRVRRIVQRQVLGFELSVGRLAAGLDGASAGTPDVRYGNVRAALDLGSRIGPMRTTLAAAFRVPLSYGELADDEWFPRVGGYGIEAQAGATYPLSSLVAVEVSASLRRFVLEMNSEPEDGGSGISEVAGGAVDSFLALYAGVRLSL
jgi:hypothetical protein